MRKQRQCTAQCLTHPPQREESDDHRAEAPKGSAATHSFARAAVPSVQVGTEVDATPPTAPLCFSVSVSAENALRAQLQPQRESSCTDRRSSCTDRRSSCTLGRRSSSAPLPAALQPLSIYSYRTGITAHCWISQPLASSTPPCVAHHIVGGHRTHCAGGVSSDSGGLSIRRSPTHCSHRQWPTTRCCRSRLPVALYRRLCLCSTRLWRTDAFHRPRLRPHRGRAARESVEGQRRARRSRRRGFRCRLRLCPPSCRPRRCSCCQPLRRAAARTRWVSP